MQEEHPCKAISVGSCSFARLSPVQIGRDAAPRRSLTLNSSWNLCFCCSGMCHLSGALLGSRVQSDRLVSGNKENWAVLKSAIIFFSQTLLQSRL